MAATRLDVALHAGCELEIEVLGPTSETTSPIAGARVEMHRRWSADYGVMKDTMSKRGVPSWDLPALKPDQALLARYEKAAGVH